MNSKHWIFLLYTLKAALQEIEKFRRKQNVFARESQSIHDKIEKKKKRGKPYTWR